MNGLFPWFAPYFGKVVCPESDDNIGCKEKMGGYVSVTVQEVRNLPASLDGFGAGYPDAYVEVQIGDSNKRSSVMSNSLNPVWPNYGEAMNFGIKHASQPVLLNVWDADSGLEFADDRVGWQVTQIPKCSVFDHFQDIKTPVSTAHGCR